MQQRSIAGLSLPGVPAPIAAIGHGVVESRICRFAGIGGAETAPC